MQILNIKKGLRNTLEVFDQEVPKSDKLSNISSRSKLIDFLCIQKLYEKNKVIYFLIF